MENKKWNKSWLSAVFLLILSVIAIIVRIYYINNLMAEVSISEDIYNTAKVSLGTSGIVSAFSEGFNIQALYVFNLYLAFMIFGNFTVAGVYLNILYQVLTVLLIFAIVCNLTNRYIGFAAGLVASIFPIYISNLSEVNMFNMQIFLVAVLSAAAVSVGRLICRLIYKRWKGEKTKEEPKPNNPAVTEIVPEEVMTVVRDTSMKEIVLDDLEDNDVEIPNKVNFIENPLPVPKRREHKEMDFAFEPSASDGDYDLNDITGMDFFDIE